MIPAKQRPSLSIPVPKPVVDLVDVDADDEPPLTPSDFSLANIAGGGESLPIFSFHYSYLIYGSMHTTTEPSSLKRTVPPPRLPTVERRAKVLEPSPSSATAASSTNNSKSPVELS